jgi:hypothetical protein
MDQPIVAESQHPAAISHQIRLLIAVENASNGDQSF